MSVPLFLLGQARATAHRHTSSLIRHAKTQTPPVLLLTTTVVLGALRGELVLPVGFVVLLAPGLFAARLAAVALPTKTAHTHGEQTAAVAAAPRDQLDQTRDRQSKWGNSSGQLRRVVRRSIRCAGRSSPAPRRPPGRHPIRRPGTPYSPDQATRVCQPRLRRGTIANQLPSSTTYNTIRIPSPSLEESGHVPRPH